MIKPRAKVTLTIEVHLNQPWDGEEKISHLFKRGAEEAMTKLKILISKSSDPMQIVGIPKVLCVMAENE